MENKNNHMPRLIALFKNKYKDYYLETGDSNGDRATLNNNIVRALNDCRGIMKNEKELQEWEDSVKSEKDHAKVLQEWKDSVKTNNEYE
jgi:hypothetical protein